MRSSDSWQRPSEGSGPHHALPVEPPELGPLTHDAIAGTYRIWQRKAGHRYSLDDVLTAWEAARVAPLATRCLELGSGIGSVLLMLAHALPNAHFHAVEAQTNSFQLLTRNVTENRLSARVTLHFGDLRHIVAGRLGPFELITGTPPYVAPGTATPSSDSQRAYARQEYRGGVEDYLAAAKPVLSADGRVVVCADARTPERVVRAAEALELTLLSQRDAVPRAGHKPALFSVFVLGHKSATVSAAQGVERHTFYARDGAGERTAEYRGVRTFFGMNDNVDDSREAR